LHKDGSVTVKDNGRGIPVDIHPELNIPGVEVVMTTLHAGGKFDSKVYQISGGLHGVGASVVCALSEYMKVRVKRNGKIYEQEFAKGVKLNDLKVVSETSPEDTGTEIIFKPDKEIFRVTEFNYEYLRNRFEELSFLIPGLEISIKDERTGKEESFKHQGGLVEFLKALDRGKEPLHEPFYMKAQKRKLKLKLLSNTQKALQKMCFLMPIP